MPIEKLALFAKENFFQVTFSFLCAIGEKAAEENYDDEQTDHYQRRSEKHLREHLGERTIRLFTLCLHVHESESTSTCFHAMRSSVRQELYTKASERDTSMSVLFQIVSHQARTTIAKHVSIECGDDLSDRNLSDARRTETTSIEIERCENSS